MKNEQISDLQFLKGVGPRRAKALNESGIITIQDLVYYFPRSYIARDEAKTISQIFQEIANEQRLQSQQIFDFTLRKEYTLICKITMKQVRQFSRKKLLQLTIYDGSSRFGKINFWNRIEFFEKLYQSGQYIVVSGIPEIDYSVLTFTHPEIEIIEPDEMEHFQKGAILPKYRITDAMRRAGLTMNQMRSIIRNAIANFTEFEETLPTQYRDMLKFPSIYDTIRALHFPNSPEELSAARYRVKFEEFFFYQLLLNLNKKKIQASERGVVIPAKSTLARSLYNTLPFTLTNAQKGVIREICDDFASSRPMNRLLQGDVGSGKTIVALLTMLIAIDAGYQVAIMAPTEILAEQHFLSFKKFIENASLDIEIVQVVSGQKASLRRQIFGDISSGKAKIIVGTHALFQNDIPFNKLAYVIIDEQHRFGVGQRAELIEIARKSLGCENISPHILVMSATPIPRTLTMTAYGELDVSIINELPKNRKPILTKVAFDDARDEIYEFVRSEIKKGRQAYIVYPLVDKSEKLELKAATEHFEYIQKEIFPEFACGLLHGQMFWYEKEEAMQKFAAGQFQILVATTVIEVGIDVPNATIMLIEDAERFGLSQLHQLRGRVGRGDEQSYCILLTKDKFKNKLKNADDSERLAALVRLRTMEQTTNGFEIAEVDLKLRGPGDILGKRQSGLPEFKYADLVEDREILEAARTFAANIIADDPNLSKPENRVLKYQIEQKFTSSENYYGIA